MTNAEIVGQLLTLAQLLAAQKANPFKIKAYRRAARTINVLPASIKEVVRNDDDLTAYAGVGKSISSAIRELVLTGKLRQVEALRAEVRPEIAKRMKCFSTKPIPWLHRWNSFCFRSAV